MSKDKVLRPKARVAKGFRDIGPEEIRGVRRMLATIQEVYESYGFEPVEQPFIEYTDALGKFLPDQDRPNEGVFSFQDDDEQWLSLRYDLTAPLARYVAEHQQSLPMPYRSYRQGWVFRNEKPGPGRYRQFMQFDADTVGTANPAADAEVCMMAADTMEALGIERGQYVIKVNNRKVLDGFLESEGVRDEGVKLAVLRAFDKFDRLGEHGLEELLGSGRTDDSGDFSKGAGLDDTQIARLTVFFRRHIGSAVRRQDYDLGCIDDETTFFQDGQEYVDTNLEFLSRWENSEIGLEGVQELRQMIKAFAAAGYGTKRIRLDPSVVRGLEYYTGPVFECELLMTKEEDGQRLPFGSVGGGGRYDDLVARFTGQSVPATGFSIGVSRLYSALKLVGKAEESAVEAPVVVLVMDRDRLGDYQKMVMRLREAHVRAEMYLGASGMKAQMKYADKRGAPLVVIQGGDEKAKGEVQIKDLRLGAELAKGIASREEYAGQRLAQFSVKEGELVEAVKKVLKR
jgi:histidyl-tRNA synthetase